MLKSCLEYWLPKLEGDRQRDIKNQEALRQMGWNVIVIWECILKKAVQEGTIGTLIQKIQAERRDTQKFGIDLLRVVLNVKLLW